PRDRYQVVHANFWMSGLVAARLKREWQVPFAITFHALGHIRRVFQGEADGSPAERIDLESEVMAAADRIVAECPDDRDNLISLYAAAPARISVIPCGVDPAVFASGDRAAARRKLRLPADAPIALAVTRMVPRKGVDNAVRAIACLR